MNEPITPKPIIRPALSLDLKTVAVAYYAAHHTQGCPDGQSGSANFIDTVKAKLGFIPIIDLAVSALALAVFSRTKNHPKAGAEATMTYHRLLQNIQKTMGSRELEVIEANLVAIKIMGRFEDAVYESDADRSPTSIMSSLKSFAHHDGSLALLRLWKDSNAQSKQANDVVMHTRRGILRSCLLRGSTVPEWLHDGASYGEHGTDLEYDDVIVRILNLRQRLSMLLEGEKTPFRRRAEYSKMVNWAGKEAREIDQALQNYVSHMPPGWGYQKYDQPASHPWPIENFCVSPWMQYFVTNMLVTSTQLRILQLSRRLYPSDPVLGIAEEACTMHLAMQAEDLIQSIPFCLQSFQIKDGIEALSNAGTVTSIVDEEVKPYMVSQVAWPMTVASGIGNLTPEHRAWFRSELARLGRIVGYGVFACAEGGDWLNL